MKKDITTTTFKKKIALFMLPPLTTGAGAEKYFSGVARGFAELGYDVDVVTLNPSSFGKFVRFMNIYYFFNLFKKIDLTSLFRETEENVNVALGEAKWVQSSFLNLRKTLQSYDVVYAKNEISELSLLAFLRFSKLPPIVVGVHTPVQYAYINSFFTKVHNFVYASLLYKWLLNKSAGIHVSNKFTQSYLQNKVVPDVRLIYYPYSVDDFLKMSSKYVFNEKFDEQKFNIAYIARLCEQKGSDILIEIVEKLVLNPRLTSKIKLNLFGTGEKLFEIEFEKLSKKYTWIKYFGHVENKYIASILSQQNLLISPARWEVSPFNVLEAQAMGIPVLASDIPGPADIVVNSKTGVLVQSKKEYIPVIKDLVYSRLVFDSTKITANIREKFDPTLVHRQLIEFLLEKAKI